MKKVSKLSHFRLPAIREQTLQHPYSSRDPDQMEDSLLEYTEKAQIQELDHWTARCHELTKNAKAKFANSLFRKRSDSKKKSRIVVEKM